jgi:hypothetical protein
MYIPFYRPVCGTESRATLVHTLLYSAYTCIRDLFIGGAIYLAEKIIRYDIFQNKEKCLYFNTPIRNYDFLGNHLKIPHFTHIAKENWKEDCNSNNTLQFSLQARR